jgi:N-acyl-D-glucosamine 2-epimerase
MVRAAFADYSEPQRTQFSDYALHGIDYIDTVLRDTKYGGFFFDTDLHGRPARNGQKHAYALAFAVFAGAKAYAVTGSERALAVATDAFEWLEMHTHTGEGCYIEDLERDGSPKIQLLPSLAYLRLRRPRNPLGNRYGRTTLNTHMHLLEAYVELYRVAPSVRLHRLVEDLAGLLGTAFDAGGGRLLAEFKTSPDSPGELAGFGHSVELAFLLLDAAESAALNNREEIEAYSTASRPTGAGARDRCGWRNVGPARN